jgi:dTMP kinase
MFFVFEGIDGAGKSTQLNRFNGWLESMGHEVITCADPGSTEVGEALRAILLAKHSMPIHMRTEMMLFTAARTQLVEEIIKPALAAEKTVVLDRYLWSTVVYQGHASDLSSDSIWQVNRIATDGLMPDATFVLDLPVDTAMERIGKSLDRMESRGTEYMQKVRDGFLTEAKRFPDQVFVVDASQHPDHVAQEIQTVAQKLIDDRQEDS